MKTAIITITTSILTSVLTLAVALWTLSNHSIPSSASTLPDGNIEHSSFNALSGKGISNVYNKNGDRLYTLVTYRDDPLGTSLLFTYNKHGLSREDVFTRPVSGTGKCEVYTPNSVTPICSYLWTSISQTGEQKIYYDANLKKISFTDFQSIRGIQ